MRCGSPLAARHCDGASLIAVLRTSTAGQIRTPPCAVVGGTGESGCTGGAPDASFRIAAVDERPVPVLLESQVRAHLGTCEQPRVDKGGSGGRSHAHLALADEIHLVAHALDQRPAYVRSLGVWHVCAHVEPEGGAWQDNERGAAVQGESTGSPRSSLKAAGE